MKACLGGECSSGKNVTVCCHPSLKCPLSNMSHSRILSSEEEKKKSYLNFLYPMRTNSQKKFQLLAVSQLSHLLGPIIVRKCWLIFYRWWLVWQKCNLGKNVIVLQNVFSNFPNWKLPFAFFNDQFPLKGKYFRTLDINQSKL